MPPASLDWRTNKNSIIFADRVAFVCFCDAQRILSTIPINTSLRKWKSGVKWERERKRGERGGIDVDGGNGSAPKIAPKRYISGIWGLPPRVIGYIVRNIFSRASFASRIVFLYLEAFRSYLASKLTCLKIQHIWPFWGNHCGLPPWTVGIHF